MLVVLLLHGVGSTTHHPLCGTHSIRVDEGLSTCITVGEYCIVPAHLPTPMQITCTPRVDTKMHDVHPHLLVTITCLLGGGTLSRVDILSRGVV